MSFGTGIGLRALYAAALTTALVGISTRVDAKTPGSTYCFISTCHRVLTLAETRAAIGKPRAMHASHYDAPSRDRFNPSLITSSGELFRPDAPNNAASPIYPDGTLVAVYAPSTKRGAIVRINNAGPYWGNRLIDLSRGLADKLGIAKSGVGRVMVEVLAAPRPEEAKYVRGRRYAPVAGFIGKVASIETVRETWQVGQGIRPAPSAAPSVVATAPTKPAAPTVATTLSLAALLSPDDMRDPIVAFQPVAAVVAPPRPIDGRRPAPARAATKPVAAPRQHLAKMPTPPFR